MFSLFLDGLSVLSEKWMIVSGAVIVTCLGYSVLFFHPRDSLEEKRIFRPGNLLPVLFFVITLILRLAFVTKAFVPPYFDSVEHHRLIKALVRALETSTLLETVPALTPYYYHLGYHFLAALLTLSLRADPIDVILILGQVVLAAIPIPIYFLIRHETKSVAAAFYGMLLAGFGWYMPGFAVNWGKYPALTGLLALELTLSIAYSRSKKYTNRSEYVILISLLILGSMVSTLFHTRTLVVIGISVLSWLIAGKIHISPKSLPGMPAPEQSTAKGVSRIIRGLLRHPTTTSPASAAPLPRRTLGLRRTTLNEIIRFQYLLPGIILAGLLVFGVFLKRVPLLNLTLEPYLSYGLWVTLTVWGLSLFALIKFPRGAYFSLFFILFVFAALFIPIPPWFPGLENQTLLDRPFVEMLLYLPLSILGGLGLAGLLQSLNNEYALLRKLTVPIRGLVFIFLLVFGGLLFSARYDLYPSDCCNFVKFDDTIALDWSGKNLPTDAHILIAAAPLNVLLRDPSGGLAGSDAGIWIPALTGRQVTLARFDSDFASASMLEELCRMQVDYIYVGGTKQSFNTTQLQANGEWYERLLFLPGAQLYRVTGCSR